MDQFERKNQLGLEARLEALKRAGFGEGLIKGVEELGRMMEGIPNGPEVSDRMYQLTVDKLSQLRVDHPAQNKDEMKGGSPFSCWYERVVQYIRNHL